MKLILSFRTILFIVLAFLAAKPVVVRPDPGLPARWAFLMDTSASMRVKDQSAVVAAKAEGRLEKAIQVAKKFTPKKENLSFFRFASDLEDFQADDIGSLAPTGRVSDLGKALRELFARNDYRGCVVFSDGRHTGSTDAVSEAALAGRPVFAVGFGNQGVFKDIAVRNIQSPPFAFKNISTALSAAISVVGFPNKEISVKLKEGDRVLSLQQVKVAEEEAEATVSFSFTPGTLGSKVLTVEASQYEGEISAVNNRKETVLDVGRDRFRVLYICGEPGPEYGFLRHQFKSDPAVELVTFVILRNNTNIASVPDSELSLIPFPTQDVLISQMATFDLVVFEEFAYQQYGLLPNVLFAIREKVQNGGSFLLMGGPAVLGPNSHYLLPGVAEMIPVEIGNDVRQVSDALPFKVKAPEHPIFRLEENPARNRQIWDGLPGLSGVVLVSKAKPGATVLGSVERNGREHPVLTVAKHGKGRIAVFTARSTWRWSMVPGKTEQGTFAYQQFWKNMVLWLTHSDQYKQVRVAAEERQGVRLGEAASLRVWVYDEYFKPISDADVRLEVIHPDGGRVEIQPHLETAGVFAASFKLERAGAYDIRALAVRRGKKWGEDRASLRVIANTSEEEDLRPNFPLLNEMARVSGGRFLMPEEFTPEIFKQIDADMSKKVGKKVLLWNSPWLLVLLLAIITFEWIFRKRRGLP